jgi:hypothetical protein
MESPQRERCPALSRVRQEPDKQGYGARASMGGVRDTEEAKTVTGRVKRAANPRVDAIGLRAIEFNTYYE